MLKYRIIQTSLFVIGMVRGQIPLGQSNDWAFFLLCKARTSQRRARAEYPVKEIWELTHEMPSRLNKNWPKIGSIQTIFLLLKSKNVASF